MAGSRQILDHAGVARATRQLARQIAKRNPDPANVVLVGIQRGGVHLAGRISRELSRLWGRPTPVGNVDVSMHRDDLDNRWPPHVHPTEIPFHLNEKTVVLVDDVLFHGRTVRAAMDALNDFGRSRSIQLAVLVDRGHRELPISADFVGKKLKTALSDRVDVMLEEDGVADSVMLEENGLASPSSTGH